MSRPVHITLWAAIAAFAGSLTISVGLDPASAQGRLGQPPVAPTAQGAPAQPAPGGEVSPVTPRGPIVLTARPPRITTPQAAAHARGCIARVRDHVEATLVGCVAMARAIAEVRRLALLALCVGVWA